jgi:hypothetical protein
MAFGIRLTGFDVVCVVTGYWEFFTLKISENALFLTFEFFEVLPSS